MWPIFLIQYFCLLSSSFLILHVVCRVVVGRVCHLRQGALRGPFIRVSSPPAPGRPWVCCSALVPDLLSHPLNCLLCFLGDDGPSAGASCDQF